MMVPVIVSVLYQKFFIEIGYPVGSGTVLVGAAISRDKPREAHRPRGAIRRWALRGHGHGGQPLPAAVGGQGRGPSVLSQKFPTFLSF